MLIHHQFTLPLIFAFIALGSVLSIIAARGNRAPWFVPLWSRRRETFTETGWRHRTRAVWCGYAALAVIVADQLFDS
jgi:hypothetical protein